MSLWSRRDVLFAACGVGLASATAHTASGATSRRKMTLCLACGRIGVHVSLDEAIDLAARHGFEALDPPNQVAGLEGDELQRIRETMTGKHVVFGAAGLPVDFRGTVQRFDAGMKALPQFAAGMQQAGVTRVGTWIRPGHAKLTFRQNFAQHAQRLRQVARVLQDHGLRLGLEYVGPKTSWTSQAFPFIHTMREMKELIAEIGRDNVGLVLDSWHWYTAGETGSDLQTLTNKDVVAVDLNDAPANVPRDEQIDSRRELPCATGVIDLATFMNGLNRIGYDGPVRAEPFNAALRAMPKEDAVATTAQAMKSAFRLIR